MMREDSFTIDKILINLVDMNANNYGFKNRSNTLSFFLKRFLASIYLRNFVILAGGKGTGLPYY